VATAQGLAAAFGIPVIPAVSADAIALEARTGHRLIWTVVDVRRGEFAVARYRPVPGGVVRETDPELVTPDVLRAQLDSAPEDSLVVGDTGAFPKGLLRGLHRVKVGKPRYPYAVALAEVARGKYEKDEILTTTEIHPMYLRDPDVTINWSKLRQEGPWAGA
jgi:tRNA threonylcarbamoyl adenosine modification protein YeaZ